MYKICSQPEPSSLKSIQEKELRLLLYAKALIIAIIIPKRFKFKVALNPHTLNIFPMIKLQTKLKRSNIKYKIKNYFLKLFYNLIKGFNFIVFVSLIFPIIIL